MRAWSGDAEVVGVIHRVIHPPLEMRIEILAGPLPVPIVMGTGWKVTPEDESTARPRSRSRMWNTICQAGLRDRPSFDAVLRGDKRKEKLPGHACRAVSITHCHLPQRCGDVGERRFSATVRATCVHPRPDLLAPPERLSRQGGQEFCQSHLGIGDHAGIGDLENGRVPIGVNGDDEP